MVDVVVAMVRLEKTFGAGDCGIRVRCLERLFLMLLESARMMAIRAMTMARSLNVVLLLPGRSLVDIKAELVGTHSVLILAAGARETSRPFYMVEMESALKLWQH